MTGSANDAALGRHLDSLASAMKRYTLAELLQVTQAVAADIGAISVSGGMSYATFTGATSIAGGLSGLVPAPAVGDQDKFLRGDGTWASISSGGGSSVASSSVILDTVASTVDGGFWFGMSDGAPILKLRKDNYVYQFSCDTRTYVGGNLNLVAYLPFDSSATDDACGNSWTATGTPSISSEQSKFGNSALRVNDSNFITLDEFEIGGQDFTVDYWAYLTSGAATFFSMKNGESLFQYFYAGRLETWFCDNGDYVGGIAFSTNTWHHIAVVYQHSAQTVKTFVDGSLVATFTNKTINRDDYSPIGLGKTIRVGGNACYIDSFRIHDGVALWTSDFTPPTAADYA